MRFASILSLILIVIFGCSKDDSSTENKFDSFDQQKLLMYWSDSLITPAYQDFYSNCEILSRSAEAFTTSPGAAELSKIQSDWLNATLALKKIEAHQFGPISDKLLFMQLDRWPVSETDVTYFIQNNATVDSLLLESKGSVVKGIPVIEYLIFRNDGDQSLVLNEFTTGSYSTIKKQYLLALCKNLHGMAKVVQHDWTTYQPQFIAGNGRRADSPLTLSVNAAINLCENLKNKKTGKPVGAIDFTQHPTEVEAYYSDNGTELIQQNLNQLAQFIGNDNKGLINLLEHLSPGNSVSDSLLLKIDHCVAKAQLIQQPLSKAVVVEEEKVFDLYKSLQDLLSFMKSDVLEVSGIPLLFSDNDGD